MNLDHYLTQPFRVWLSIYYHTIPLSMVVKFSASPTHGLLRLAATFCIIVWPRVCLCITFFVNIFCIIEGSFEIKLPTIWADEKQRWEEAERREE